MVRFKRLYFKLIKKLLYNKEPKIKVKNITVLLDNGHGIETSGKRSPLWEDNTQLFEWSYTRRLTDAIKTRLESMDINTIKIVPGDSDVSLSKRAAIVNSYCKTQSCILVSVHLNAFDGTAKGWEIWTTTKNNNSDKLAECFLDNFECYFPDKKLRGAKEKDYTLLYKSNCPCVLTENFFMDNEEECRFLMSEEGFNKVVDLHVSAILKYLRE